MDEQSFANKTASRNTGGRLPVARQVVFNLKLHRRRLGLDKLTAKFVVVGGIAIIFSILAIMVVIMVECYPLFKSPKITKENTFELGDVTEIFEAGSDEYREISYIVHAQGITCHSLSNGQVILDSRKGDTLPLDGAVIVTASQPQESVIALGLSDGRMLLANLKFKTTFPNGIEGARITIPELTCKEPVVLKNLKQPVKIQALAHRLTDEESFTALATKHDELALIQTADKAANEDFVGLAKTSDDGPEITMIPLRPDGHITAIAISEAGGFLFVGTSTGRLVAVNLKNPEKADVVHEVGDAGNGKAITKMTMLLGSRTVVLGNEEGQVSSWQMVRDTNNRYRITRIHAFEGHDSAVVAISPSTRNKGFATADKDGAVYLHYGTTGETLLKANLETTNLSQVAFAPKDDGILAVTHTGTLTNWKVDNPHPEVTFNSLFGKIWYEGYSKPEYTWQSTAGTDDYEPKLSLTPLIVGTLKGTFYALLFAIPLGLMGAFYTSQFMHPKLRDAIKPVIEIMAALPSVVLGFLAGLWLAPKVEAMVPGIFLMILFLPMTLCLGVVFWEILPANTRTRFIRPGYEIFLLMGLVLTGGWAAVQMGDLMNYALLGNDYRSWLLSSWGIKFDQRNSLVVGIAMGVAVIPIIFTIAEDSLSNVPRHLRAGALALGSTPWQAAVRVILPTASPGIFSAIMIGFGRAVGETMIVLMATGNTPIMDFSAFSGFRALSANIAVELPEAAHGDTHYRILFLAALILFGMTFVVNTLAEVIRLRLRKKYRLL